MNIRHGYLSGWLFAFAYFIVLQKKCSILLNSVFMENSVTGRNLSSTIKQYLIIELGFMVNEFYALRCHDDNHHNQQINVECSSIGVSQTLSRPLISN